MPKREKRREQSCCPNAGKKVVAAATLALLLRRHREADRRRCFAVTGKQPRHCSLGHWFNSSICFNSSINRGNINDE
ncbi:unnamed protein product [Cuscuta campestris]|uniref:Uncharacterized protein n=1 Tax=Cuscuta campestris TaxID=132261 RepID=A0A484MP69_9ASTE|nr:unnamed protein product [Cuscuta campestris]